MSEKSLFLLVAGAFVIALVLDLRWTSEPSTRKAALARAIGWVVLAAASGALLQAERGGSAGLAFAGAYISELALSFDNVGAFIAIFMVLGLGTHAQHRVLSWGVLGALLTRALLIAVATITTRRWTIASSVLGGLLLASAAWGVMVGWPQSTQRPSHSRLAAALSKRLHVAQDREIDAFFVRQGAHLRPTLLAVAVVAVELTDVVCSFDSVPTALAVTGDPLTLYASNILAVAALRALYGVLASAPVQGRVILGIATLLIGMAGTKLLLAPWWSPPLSVTVIALGTVGAALGAAATVRAVHHRRPLTNAANGAIPAMRKPSSDRR